MFLSLLAGLLFTSQSCYSLSNCSNNSVEFKCTEIVALIQSDSNSTLSVSTRQFDCCTGSSTCGNSSSLENNESCANSVNITICNSFTNTTSNCSCLTSKTSETHIASGETLSGCLPIVSYQTVSTISPNVLEATCSIFVVAILLLLGTNIAFCIALCIIKRNQLKKVLQVQQVKRFSLNQDNQVENQVENQLNERNRVSNSEDDKTYSSMPYREPNELTPPLEIAYSDLVSEKPYDENEPTTTSHQKTMASYSVVSKTQSQAHKRGESAHRSDQNS